MHASLTLRFHRPPQFSQRCERAAVDFTHGRARKPIFEAEQTPTSICPCSYPPAVNVVGGWSQIDPKKCQQDCQQTSTRVAQGQFWRSSPASLENAEISVHQTFEARVADSDPRLQPLLRSIESR